MNLPDLEQGSRLERASSDYLNLRFEPGHHPTTIEEVKALEDKLNTGELGCYAWNHEVSQRLVQYHPRLIAIDGLYPNYPRDIDSKRKIWMVLPDRPKVISGDKSIFVVAGDLVIHNDITQVLESVDNHRSGVFSRYKELSDSIGDTGSYIPDSILTVALVGLVYDAVRSTIVGINHNDLRQEFGAIPRRTALKALLGGALLLGSRMVSVSKASESSGEFDKQLWLKVVNILQPKVIVNDWVVARTAALITKSHDAARVLNMAANSNAAVVMGGGHGFEAEQLVEDPEYRVKRIGDFVGGFRGRVLGILDQYPKVDKKAAWNKLLDFFATYEIIKIDDPGGPDVNPKFSQMVERLITPVGGKYVSVVMKKAVDKYRL